MCKLSFMLKYISFADMYETCSERIVIGFGSTLNNVYVVVLVEYHMDRTIYV
jgi:hypothetical protein